MISKFLKMEDYPNSFENGMLPKTIKSKNNGCGTAPGNLVFVSLSKFRYIHLTDLALFLLLS